MSSRRVSRLVLASSGEAVGTTRFIMVIQKMRQLRTQNTAIRFTIRCAVRSFDASALQPDFRTLWNVSTFHRTAYQEIFPIAVYEEVVRRFGEAGEPALREQVAKALVNKGVRLGALNRSQEAIAVYEEVVWRFGEAGEPALRATVALAKTLSASSGQAGPQ